MAKKTAKKTTKKAAKTPVKKTPKKQAKAPKKSSINWQVIGLGVLVVIAFILIYIGVSNLIGTADSAEPTEQPVVAATVNGVEITTNQLETQYAILPDQYKMVYTKDMVLQQLIDEELLIAHGADQGLTVTREEVNTEIQEILASGQITITELQQNLDAFNLTIEDFENLIERKLMIERSMADLVSGVSPATEEDAIAYYQANAAQFITDEQVRVRHILIASTRDNAAQFSKDLLDQVKAGADFCALVEEETEDTNSIPDCGEYTFGTGVMVPEFEKASFELAPGELTLVQTQFGYHIIEKLEDVPAGVISFEDSKDAIIARLNQENQLRAYQDFLADAKNNADVQVFYQSPA